MVGAWAKLADVLSIADWGYNVVMLGVWVLIGLVAFHYVIVTLIRRKLARQQQAASEQPFTLDELRDLYRQGQLTQAEYERAKARMAQRYGVGEGDVKAADPGPGQADVADQDGTSSS
jgi:hypothetical protein